MAGFFNLPSSRATTKKDQQLLKKVSNPVKSSSTITLKGSTKLIDRIQAITSFVKSKFAGKEDELELITTEEHLISYIDKCIENNVISIDTETTGLDPILDNIVGICIYTPGLKAAYIPVNHISYITELKCANQLEIPFLTEQFQRLVDNNVKTIWFNAPFDIRFLGNHINVWFNAYFDTSIASKCLNSNEPEGARSLKALHKKYCWGNRGEALTFGKLFDNIPFNLIPIDVAYLYAASDAIYTYELYEFQAQYLEPNGKYYESHNMQRLSDLFFNIEMKSMETFIFMEQNGTAIDYEYADKLKEKYHSLAEKMEQNLQSVYEVYADTFEDYRRKHPMCKLTDPINFDSPTQLAIILYDVLQIPPVDKRNPRSTDKNVLREIEHPLCKAILDNRSFKKVISTYIDILPEDAKRYPDKRIHCKFNQYGADCIVGDSLLLTDSGYCEIRSLFDGSEMEGVFYPCSQTIYNKDIKKEECSKKIVFYNTKTLCIKTRGGYTLTGTPNHPIICSSLTKQDIKRNKSSRQIRQLSENLSFRNLEDVCVGDIVAIPISYNVFPKEYRETNLSIFKHNLTKEQHIIPKLLTEDFAEFLGMFFADGGYDFNCGTFRVSLSNKNPEVIDRFVYLCKELFGVTCITEKQKHTLQTSFSSLSHKELCKYLTKGARNKKIPADIMNSPRSVVCSFIRGMTLDSSLIESEQALYLTCVDKVSNNFVKQVLLNMGIITGVKRDYYKEGFDHLGNKVSKLPVEGIVITGEMYEKFLNTVGVIESKKRLILPSYNKSQYLHDENYYYAYVNSIDCGANTVYDLTVPETHSFICQGFICHNTGRVSSNSPNLQNIPSNPFVLSDGTKIDAGHDIRQLFTASKGCILMSCDYSGQEVRVTAHLSQDEKLIQAYREDKDPYSEIASLAYNVPYEECCEHRPDGTFNADGKARRGEAKKIVLGVLYGRGIPSIAEQLGKTPQEAQIIYNKVLNKFEGLAKFISESEDMAREYGYVTTVWGRRRQLPDMQLPYYEFKYKNGVNPDFDPLSGDANEYSDEVPEDIVEDLTNKLLHCRGFKQREQFKEKIRNAGMTIKDNSSFIARAQRQCVNARVQGSAADLTKLAQIELFNNKELKELGFKMLIPVHDEIIAECPIENAKRCSELMSECMLNAGRDLCVPLSCDVELFRSWYGESVDVNTL